MRSTPRLLCSLLAISTSVLPACVELSDEPALSDEESEIGSHQWPDDTAVPDRHSTRQPAMASFNNRVYMAYTDASASSTSDLLVASWDGTTWFNGPTSVGLTTTRPALAAFNSRLHLFFRRGTERTLQMQTSAGATFSIPQTVGRSLSIGSYTPSSPSAIVIGTNLYLTYCANNGTSSYVNVDKYDGTTWTAFHQVPVSYASNKSCKSAALAVMPEGGVELHFNTIDLQRRYNNDTKGYETVDEGLLYRQRGQINRSSTVWHAAPELMPFKSRNGFSVMTCNGVTHFAHTGYDYATRVYWSYRTSAGTWATDGRVANQWTDSGPALGCLNGTTPLMVHDESGSGTRLLQSIYAP